MSGESGAGHQLDLVEDHQWQDDEAQGLAGEQHARHRDAGDEALFRAAEHDRDLVLAQKPKPRAATAVIASISASSAAYTAKRIASGRRASWCQIPLRVAPI
jgi:hypothetical protein